MKQELINSILELQKDNFLLIDYSPKIYTKEELEKKTMDMLRHIEYQLLFAMLPY